MSADIRARFLPRFAKLAAERVERALAHAALAEWAKIAAELHALSGEAALLELREIAALAREGEATVRGSPSVEGCEELLRALAAQIEAIRP